MFLFYFILLYLFLWSCYTHAVVGIILFYSISFCWLYYTLMLWVIMFWVHMVLLTSYVLADVIAKSYSYYVNMTDVVVIGVKC